MSIRSNVHGNRSSLLPFLARNALIALISILCVLVVGQDLYQTLKGRSREIEDSRREVSNLALAAAQQAEDVFRLADNRVIGLVERVETDGIGPTQIERLRKLMAVRLVASPSLQGLTVIDQAGDRVVDAQPVTQKINLADRSFFQDHATHPDRGPYTSRPLLSRTAGVWVILISRRVDHADGSFAGAVTATVDVQYFQRFYATFEIGHDGSASLRRVDGTLLVRRPVVETSGRTIGLGPVLEGLLAKSPSGTFESPSQFDGEPKIVGYRRVPGFPMVAIMALGETEQLANWRTSAYQHLLSAVTAISLLGFLVVRLTRQMSLLALAKHAASDSAERATEAMEHYRLLADNSTDVIVVIDRQLVPRYVSPSCRELLGYEPEELTGKKAKLLLHPEDFERAIAAFQLLLARGSPGHDRITYRLRHRDGHWVWIESLRKVFRYSEAGEAMEVCSALRDVGERVTAEIELRDSEERFRTLLNSRLTEACYLLDADGTIETWNAAAERVKGYAPTEIIGQNFSVFFTPEDRARGEPSRALAEARAKGSFAAEGWRVRKDGSLFPARVALEAIVQADGTPRGFVKITFDLTKQRIEEEERAIIIEAAPNGMMIVDESGVITLVNSQMERIFGYPRGALLGQPVELLVPDGYLAAYLPLPSVNPSGRSDMAMEPQRQFVGRKSDGTPVTVEIMLNAVKTPKGHIVVASLFDVTERRRLASVLQESEAAERLNAAETNDRLDRLARHLAKARDRAEQANEAKSRFLTGITHELRTPLHGILGYAELLSLEGDLNTTQSERVHAMIAAGEHLLGMINAVLDVSQIEADRLELHPIEIELTEFVHACLDVIRPSAQAKGLSLVLTAPANLRILADSTRLRQVVINLLGNAIKFTPSGTVGLRVKQAEDAAYVRLEVADTGPGIGSHHIDKLFQTFERLNDTVIRIEGAGVGLSLAARLVELMGGRIGYVDNPGGGSVFWLELPVTNGAPGIAEAVVATPTGTSPGLRVMVVDDDALNRNIASGFLKFGNHEVVCLDNGAAAVAAAAAADFDVILMDVRMPGMTGLEATRLIRALPNPRGLVPIVAATAQAYAEQIAKCLDAGMSSHVSKPFKQAALLVAVENAARAGTVPVDHTAVTPEVPVFDHVHFENTTGGLPPGDIVEHVRTLIKRGDALLLGLRAPDILPRAGELAEAAHLLTGSAATFGFMALAAAGRRFEFAADSGALETVVLADQLATAIDAAVTIMREELVDVAARAS